ncbi:MAG TPA: DUF72 domain-containing protein [Anaerolineales bacterium]|nr:DUF72 domain-containing protein [Anaerolineales bacterium]
MGGEFLLQYARRLTNIEGNTSFYAAPVKQTLENWVENTPDNLVAPYLCKGLYQLAEKDVNVPPLPWDETTLDIPEQPSLF